MNENALSSLRPGVRTADCWTSEVVAAAVNQRKEECGRKNMQY